MPPRRLPDAETLRRLYHGEGLTSSQIGALYGVVPDAVTAAMRRAGIPRRAPGHPLSDEARDGREVCECHGEPLYRNGHGGWMCRVSWAKTRARRDALRAARSETARFDRPGTTRSTQS